MPENTGQLDTLEGTPERKKAILDELEDHYGIVTDACRKIGLARSTFYNWLQNDSDFKAAVDEIQDVALDFVEGKLFERINGVEVVKGVDKDGEEIIYSLPPDVQAIGLYLRTKGKRRGYIERQEVTGPDGKAIVTETHVKIIRDKTTGIAPGEFTPQSAGGTGSEEKI